MGRIRSIKPELFKHGELYDLEKSTGLPLRLAWMGIFTLADREGRFAWKPREMQTDVLPYDQDVKFGDILDALAEAGFIVKYEVEGKSYGYIPSWLNHQVIRSDEAKSRIPAPPEHNKAPQDTPPPEPETNPNGSDTDSNEVDSNQHRGVGVGTGMGVGSGVGVTRARGAPPAAQGASPPGSVHPDLRGNSALEQILAFVPLVTQGNWLEDYTAKSVKLTLKNAMNFYLTSLKVNAVDGVPGWGEKLVGWMNREEETLEKRKAGTVTPMKPAVDPPPYDIPPAAGKLKLGKVAQAALAKSQGGG